MLKPVPAKALRRSKKWTGASETPSIKNCGAIMDRAVVYADADTDLTKDTIYRNLPLFGRRRMF